MKVYKLTLMKDLPGVKAGYSKVFNEVELSSTCGWRDWKEADYALREYQDDREFVNKEIYLDRAIPGIICSTCNQQAFFSGHGNEILLEDGDVTICYLPVMIECAICGKIIHISNVCTKRTVHW